MAAGEKRQTAVMLNDDGATPPATIRSATREDLDRLVAQTWAVAAEGRWIAAEVPFDRIARRRQFATQMESPGATLLVADATSSGGPSTVGHISVTIASYGVADIGMLLGRGWRGRGIGNLLLGAAITWAIDGGAHKMALEVWPDNAAAIALYRKAGFVEEGRKRAHYRRRSGECWDAVLMGRPLP